MNTTVALWIWRRLRSSCFWLPDDGEVEIPPFVSHSKECFQLVSDQPENSLHQNHSEHDYLLYESHLSEDQPQPKGQLEPVLDEPQHPIHSLSADILYYLAVAFLPVNDTASLALTCKAAFIAVDGKKVLQEWQSQPLACRAEFLRGLERDFPGHILCYQCAKFHSRFQSEYQDVECDFNSCQMYYGQCSYRVLYKCAKEIVNHYRFGPRYGRSERELIPKTLYSISKPEDDVKGIDCIDLKCVGEGDNVNLIFRRYIWVEYDLSNPKSREAAKYVVLMNSLHILGPHWRMDNLTDEIPPTSYCCKWCGAEREHSIVHLRDKPGYAALRSTLWENVGQCENTEHGLWTHVCDDWLMHREEEQYVPIRQCDLTYLYAFVGDASCADRERYYDPSVEF
ncbi:hypothetical protein MGYG_03869 [Nannizzia gypsea CBS 118893]|uniref:F-box domain-containing protein n=1 Tax=Arthroderma gypseum (strain ATCC MYA-4604 / CBS 118893) TaxID=535722 RepID=E4UU99_ARTGP|nr:hypothetical protein MGYG_03869 [Nannizzia gypsea CBS 118893]EFR00866.1 hypothetical protein MGYG_03869 [Nannizzia gypsea CBS 118893]